LSTSPSVITDFNEDETWLRFAIVTALSVIDIREENGGTDFVFNDKGFSIVTFEFGPAKLRNLIRLLMLMHRGATEENDCIDGTPSSSSAVIMTTRERLTTTIIFTSIGEEDKRRPYLGTNKVRKRQ
jgi:hypothetical protein